MGEEDEELALGWLRYQCHYAWREQRKTTESAPWQPARMETCTFSPCPGAASSPTQGSLEIHSQFTGDKERQSCAHWLKLLWHYHCKQCRESPTKQEWVTARWAIQKIPSCREAPLQQQKTPQYIDSHRGEFWSMWLVSKYKHLKYDIVMPSMACSLVTHGWRSY